MDLAPAFEGLTDRERLYVEGVLKGLPKRAAAQAAGMNPTTTGQLDSRPAIAAALAKGREISIRETGVTRTKITDMLLEAWRNCVTATEQVVVARELGKLHGLYEAKKVEVKHQLEHVTRADQLRTLTVAELERIAAGGGPLVIEGEFTSVSLPLLEHEEARYDD